MKTTHRSLANTLNHWTSKRLSVLSVLCSPCPLWSIFFQARLFREPPNAEGNRQPDHDHVHQQP